MNNTALRASAQSATSHKESSRKRVPPYDNTHMVFANEEHEKFYFEKLEKARPYILMGRQALTILKRRTSKSESAGSIP